MNDCLSSGADFEMTGWQTPRVSLDIYIRFPSPF